MFRGSIAVWEQLLAAFREIGPGNLAEVSRRAGVSRVVARKAWATGWKAPSYATRSMREIIEEEQEEARILLAQKNAELRREQLAEARKRREEPANDRQRKKHERELAKLDAAHERAREAEGVRASVSAALLLLANVSVFARASNEVAQSAAETISTEARAGRLGWRDALQILTKLTWLAQHATGQLSSSMTALRIHLGDASVVGTLAATPPEGTRHEVDGAAAVAELGEDRVRQAAIDLASGIMTPDVERLIEWQADRAQGVPSAN